MLNSAYYTKNWLDLTTNIELIFICFYKPPLIYDMRLFSY